MSEVTCCDLFSLDIDLFSVAELAEAQAAGKLEIDPENGGRVIATSADMIRLLEHRACQVSELQDELARLRNG